VAGCAQKEALLLNALQVQISHHHRHAKHEDGEGKENEECLDIANGLLNQFYEEGGGGEESQPVVHLGDEAEAGDGAQHAHRLHAHPVTARQDDRR